MILLSLLLLILPLLLLLLLFSRFRSGALLARLESLHGMRVRHGDGCMAAFKCPMPRVARLLRNVHNVIGLHRREHGCLGIGWEHGRLGAGWERRLGIAWESGRLGIGWEHGPEHGRIGAWALAGSLAGSTDASAPGHWLGGARRWALAGALDCPSGGLWLGVWLFKPPTSATARTTRKHRNPYPGPHEKLHVLLVELLTTAGFEPKLRALAR